MSTGIKIPRGADSYFHLAFTRAGAAADLTGATLAAWLRYSADDAAADAIATTTGASPALSLTLVDAPAGIALLKITAAATAGLPRGLLYHLLAQATLADADVVISPAHQFLVALTPLDPVLADLIAFDTLPVAGVSPWLEPAGSVWTVPSAMSNYLFNRYDLTGLTGGAATDLDGLPAATLASLLNGAKIELSFAGDIELAYKLRARAPADEAEAAPWVIVCDNDTTRCWELTRVTRSGQPCTYNAITSLWHKLWAVGADGSATPSLDAAGFTIPT